MRLESTVDKRELSALESVNSGHRMAFSNSPGSVLIGVNLVTRARRRWPPVYDLIGSFRRDPTVTHIDGSNRLWSKATTGCSAALDPQSAFERQFPLPSYGARRL